MALLEHWGESVEEREPTLAVSAQGRTPGRAFILLTLFLAFGLAAPQAHGQTFKEQDVKAAFLYHFAQFVDWPPEAFPDPDTSLIIGILGTDPFGATLDQIVQGEVVKNRRLEVRRYRRVEEIDQCHILFISRSEERRLEQILLELSGKHVLTVGDSEGFALRGGMIRFMTEKNKIRLRINLDAAKAASVTISSKLLRAAEVIGPGESSR